MRFQKSLKRIVLTNLNGLWIGLLLTSSASCQEQEVNVTLTVKVPPITPKDARIFVAGNHSSLGDWNPGKIELQKENDSVWSRIIRLPRWYHVEYKITRGSWNTQAVYETGILPGNSRFVAMRDTGIDVNPITWTDAQGAREGGIVGTVRYHRGLNGNGLRYERDLIVWLPPSYASEQKRRYPVLYMHDGQNIFDPSTSFIGYDWHADEVADSLIRAGTIEEIIIVGIYNSPDRMLEYSDTNLGRQYAQFVATKVKPLIDSVYRTKPDRANTAVMGSSMGGLISFLFVWWHPEVFSKAGCLSSTFSFDHGKLLDQVEEDSDTKRDIRIYMDCGGYGGESSLKPGMDSMVNLLQKKGYVENQDFLSFYDERADHSERAWAARIWRPLTFLFGK